MRIRQSVPRFGHPVFLVVLVFTFGSGATLQLRAQDTEEPAQGKERRGWINVGIAGSPAGMGLGGSVSIKALGPLVITGRAVGVQELQICFGGTCPREPDRAEEVAVLAGLATQNRIVLASLSVGVGLALRTMYSETVREVGLPLDLQLYFLPTRGVGFGVTWMANFYRGSTFWAGAAGVQFRF